MISLPAFASRGSLIAVLALALAACNKQEDSAPAPVGGAATSPPLAAAECDLVPDPAPVDGTPTGKSTAVSRGIAARAACKKAASASQASSNTDVLRIREMMEKREAERAESKASGEEWSRRMKEGGKAPLEKVPY